MAISKGSSWDTPARPDGLPAKNWTSREGATLCAPLSPTTLNFVSAIEGRDDHEGAREPDLPQESGDDQVEPRVSFANGIYTIDQINIEFANIHCKFAHPVN